MAAEDSLAEVSQKSYSEETQATLLSLQPLGVTQGDSHSN